MKKCLLLFIIITVLQPCPFAQERSASFYTPALSEKLSMGRKDEWINALVLIKDPSSFTQSNSIQVLYQYKGSALVRLTARQLDSLLKNKIFLFADIFRAPKEELTTGDLDLSLNAISLLHSRYPQYNGTGISVSIKEQRFDTSDIDIKGRSFLSGTEDNTQSSHASIMATIVAGAGNSSPFALGVAPGAKVYSSGFSTLLPDPDSVFRKYGISIQNHSYGTGIENYYGADAAAYDQSAWNNPDLVYVFSSGNSGNATPPDGIYAGIPGVANITGSFKMAKNIITVGATDSFNIVSAKSSRGPAFDGRLKPDLVAFGVDGTSGSAALVSGTAAILQGAYRQFHNNLLPSSALIKAVLVNSADDIGPPHPDFINGYGSLNAFNAFETINNNRYAEDILQPLQSWAFPLIIPQGVAQLKITLSWTDTPAHTNKILFNDLDLSVSFPSTSVAWYPWILDASPNSGLLAQAAYRGIDTLNNTEQITIDTPLAGKYMILVKGDKIKTSSPQAFAVAWQMDTLNHLQWTFPSSSDAIVGGSANLLRWQTNMKGTGSLEYSFNGNQWILLSNGIQLSDQYYYWNAPDTISRGILRITAQNSVTVASDTFVITRNMELKTGFNCKDSFLLYWNHIGARSYQLYELGAKYLEPFALTGEHFIVLDKKSNPILHYSVAPVIDGKPGRKSFTINYSDQGTGCYINSFYALLQPDNKVLLTLQLGTLYQVSSITFQRFTGTDFADISTLSSPASLQQSVYDDVLTQGIHLYRARIQLQNGSTIYSDIQSIYYFPLHPVIIYPNPARQNEPVQIIVKDQGVYNIKIYDGLGKFIKDIDLNDIYTIIPSFTLSQGMYYVMISTGSKRQFVQKLIVN